MPPFWLSRDEVRELDRRAIEGFGVPGIVLMENAGRSCAELLMRLNPEKKPAVILCGPGNNGGDGFVIARHLDNYGLSVEVYLFEPGKLTGDAAVQFEPVNQSPIVVNVMRAPDVTDWARVLREDGRWVVDALFGTGLSRPLVSPYSDVVAGVNTSGCPVLSVDIPSGLDCDTGEPLGPTVRALHTATFVAQKTGFAAPAAREWLGQVHVLGIGVPPAAVY